MTPRPILWDFCPACSGSGYGSSYDGAAYWTCLDCSGTGQITAGNGTTQPTGETNV